MRIHAGQGIFNDSYHLADKMSYSAVLQHPTADFASVIPDIDAKAEHDRLQAGIGPPEEENPIEMFRAVGLTISNKT